MADITPEAKELYDYLTDVVPDNSETFAVYPSGVNEIVYKKQSHMSGHGTEEIVINLLDDLIVRVELTWNVKNESDAGTILDFWNDTTKGNGVANSFIWTHPTDGHQYTVRFDSSMTRQLIFNDIFGISTITLRVLGYYTP